VTRLQRLRYVATATLIEDRVSISASERATRGGPSLPADGQGGRGPWYGAGIGLFRLRRLGGQAMTRPQIDYAAVLQQIPIPMVLLTPEFVIADMNLEYLRVAGRTRDELLGRDVFEAFPDNPANPGATGVHELSASLTRVLATGKPDAISMQEYDVEVPGSPGLFAKRFWSPVNAPVFGPDGHVELIVQCVEEITDRVQRFIGGLAQSDARDGSD
jgi:PAS domain-containing protein